MQKMKTVIETTYHLMKTSITEGDSTNLEDLDDEWK